MDLKQLAAVNAVAQVGSVTKAGQLLHLVQPAVTRQIRSLELELGVSLFERTHAGMVLTREGELLVERARRVFFELDRARAELKPSAAQLTGLVTVGMLESAVDLIGQSFVARMAHEFPGVKLHVLTAFSGHLAQWLEEGATDISLLYNAPNLSLPTAMPLLEESLWAVAPAAAGLRPGRPVTWKRVLAQPLVLPVHGHGLRDVIDAARAELKGCPEIMLETNSMRVQKQCVLSGRAWTILPAVGVATEVASGELAGGPLSGPTTTRSVAVATRSLSRRAPAVDAAASVLRDLIRELVRSGGWPSARLVSYD